MQRKEKSAITLVNKRSGPFRSVVNHVRTHFPPIFVILLLLMALSDSFVPYYGTVRVLPPLPTSEEGVGSPTFIEEIDHPTSEEEIGNQETQQT